MKALTIVTLAAACLEAQTTQCPPELQRGYQVAFGKVYASAAVERPTHRPLVLEPAVVCGHVNADSVPDLFAFGSLQTKVRWPRDLVVQIAAPLNMSGRREKWIVSASFARKYYQGSPAVFVLLSTNSSTGPQYRPFVVVKFLDFSAKNMQVSSRVPAEVSYPHDIHTWRPRPAGQILYFTDERGTGTGLFWDGHLFRWIPIEDVSQAADPNGQ
jgi:hypothetical protein